MRIVSRQDCYLPSRPQRASRPAPAESPDRISLSRCCPGWLRRGYLLAALVAGSLLPAVAQQVQPELEALARPRIELVSQTAQARMDSLVASLPRPSAGQMLANHAAGWTGRAFKAGETRRCADFVSTMLTSSGLAPPGFGHLYAAAEFAKLGTSVTRDELKPGDVVLFSNTYRTGKYTHVGIYLGQDQFVHRPTANQPVRLDSLLSGYYAQRFTVGQRLY